ncbi:apoptosis-inducing TAF9-like domain 1 family protein [Penicillium longicatenatum]|uniref:apoptosis-inducing TAF9-like domain 1 family protein n=1 Tax=Penicillium longicatenatum TaxID=1561947 RepID=UPI002548BD1D|nr:apoptosis-inducing TAF9-like domain 1 family protein [Penicillium longicatenatum]KAJ5643469.1 apoptosis-inducing TAF9-like domain 1 family protein [Penicillium longicatenatum]KAJ5645136.1 apoptosis-inducing TAF9-like domain 1 family protein [Penicillium longicatenatum]
MSQNEQEAGQNQAERLKIELYDCVSKIVDEETLKLDAMATPQFTNALLELAWSHLESAVVDVEAFAKHAGRSTVTPADVLMLCRRNDGLNQTLQTYMAHLESEREEAS